MRGDIDGDGKITENDRNRISEHLGGTITLTGADSWCAKVTGNNEISVSDLIQLMQYLEGKTNNLTGIPTFADYYNNWTYHKVDDLTGYWTAEVVINGLKTTSDAIVNISNDEGIFYKSELSDGAISFYATRPPIAEVPATITFKPGTGVITTSYESAKFHAATHSKDGADPIIPESIGALSLSGGTMTGSLILKDNPAKDLEAATKQYVDNHTISAMVYESGLPEKPSAPIADGQEIPYSWDELNAIALSGKAADYVSVGAIKSVTLSEAVLGTTTHDVRVIGINQDNDQSITFQTKNCLATDTPPHTAIWIDSSIRTKCQNYYNAFPGKTAIKTVKKGTCSNISTGSSRNDDVTYNDETVWLPSEREMGLDHYSPLSVANSSTNKAECTQGKNFAYQYYTSNNSRIKYNGDSSSSAVHYWERSRCYKNTGYACAVNNGGSAYYSINSISLGFAPAFVIGNGTFSAKITQEGEDITDKVKEIIGGAQIATGSYTGTNTYGSSNPNSLTFEFEPKLVLIYVDSTSGANGYFSHGVAIKGSTVMWAYGSVAYRCHTTWSGKTLSWYCDHPNYTSIGQLNYGILYRYIAFG